MATHGLPTWPWTETTIEHLPPPEALLLEAMRRWAEAARQGAASLPACHLPLVAEDAAGAARPLDALLRAREPHGFAIGTPLHPRLTGDEPALLLALSLSQRGPRREALAGFLRLMPPAPAAAAMAQAVSVGAALRRAGWLLATPLR